MAYRIYTYQDPYRIDETDFWPEIREYPHFCSARTLARAMTRVLGEENVLSLICPLDAIVDNLVFADWSRNISRRIEQYSEIGRLYDKWRKINANNPKYPDDYFEALGHTRSSMLDAVRLFIELGITSGELSTKNLNPEHRIFKAVLKETERNPLFILPEIPSPESFRDVLKKQCDEEETELKDISEGRWDTDEVYRQQKEAFIGRMRNSVQNWDGKHIVIHGIHQFTPLQLRLLTGLEKKGIEIIFIYNYLPEFSQIYSSWDEIYSLFGVEIHQDQKAGPYVYAPTKGKAIAENLGLICEKTDPKIATSIRSNYKLYESEPVYCFDNVSEFAGYVSDEFSEAEKELRRETGKAPSSHSTGAVLAKMKEVIYTANKDVDDLLQVYHPEYARKRHFLSYPIGQFFVALYALWNTEAGEICIDFGLIRECLNSGILTQFDSSTLMKTLLNLEPLFQHISTYSEFEQRFKKYKEQYAIVQTAVGTSDLFPLKNMIIYQPEKISVNDIEQLESAIKTINDSALTIFGSAKKNERLSFEQHFKALQDFVANKQASMAEGEEKDLIDQLVLRLDSVTSQMHGSESSGTLEDIRAGLYYFLKEKEKHLSDWFVRNFEQIDGDILLSNFDRINGIKRNYHFACVSDRDMNISRDELLPWPLTQLFIERAYNPKDLVFQVYYTAQGERNNFMRYALFYGLYFGQGISKISYVRRQGEDQTNAYEPLMLIGMDEEPWIKPSVNEKHIKPRTAEKKTVTKLSVDQMQVSAFFLCPYRYFQDYVLKSSPMEICSYLSSGFFFRAASMAARLCCPSLINMREDIEIDRSPTSELLSEGSKQISPSTDAVRAEKTYEVGLSTI